MTDIGQLLPNVGIERKYRQQLKKMLDGMNKSVLYWVLADYEHKTTKEMARQIQKRIKQWKKVFGARSDMLAEWFVREVKKNTIAGFTMNLNKLGVRKHIEVPEEDVEAVLIENETLIESIPEKYFDGIMWAAMAAMTYGWSKTDLREAITKRYNISKRRIKNIAADQNHKANEAFKTAVCEKLGITKGRWKYTFRSKEPRWHHIKADGRLFNLKRGCLIEGEYVHPGEPYNCKCTFTPVIDGFGDL